MFYISAFLIYIQGEFDKAQTSLEKAVETHFPDRAKFRSPSNSYVADAERKVCAKVRPTYGDLHNIFTLHCILPVYI